MDEQPTRPLVDLREVHKSFRDGRGEREVLRGVHLEVHPGELIALMGPSGSGKSTLLTIAGGLERADHGQVVVGGHHLRALDARGLAALRRDSVGYVEQQLNLLASLSAAENVALPLELGGVRPRTARLAAVAALDSVGLGEMVDSLPDDLSGGEQQRVAIARALIGDRRVLLADEPTGALDSLTGESIMRLLRARCDDDGAAVVIATHNSAHAAWADRVIHLRDGQLVERATAVLDRRLRAASGEPA
jgi:putative ABC transport system ATP-binding protein